VCINIFPPRHLGSAYHFLQTASAIGRMLSGFLQAVDVYTLQSQRIAFVGILILQRSAYSGSNGVSMVLSGGSVGNIIKGPRFYPFTPSSLIGLSVVDGIITIPIALLGFFVMPGTILTVCTLVRRGRF
jgi:hypothetical protein